MSGIEREADGRLSFVNLKEFNKHNQSSFS